MRAAFSRFFIIAELQCMSAASQILPAFKDILKSPCKFSFDEMSHSQYVKLILNIILG